MGWDVKEEMVDLLADYFDSDPEIADAAKRKLQSVAVLQHCSLRDMTLFEFFARFRVDGMRLIPLADVLAAAAFSEVEFPSQDDLPAARPEDVDNPEWNHSHWRKCVGGVDRLECLRKHIAEVATVWGAECVLWHELRRHEASLARVVEPVPTLGMVADDDVNFFDQHPPCDEPDDDAVSDKPASVIPPASPAEQAGIAAVLANPKSAAPVADSAPRKDAQGRPLASEATIAELYACAERLGINKVAAQELACKQFKLRAIDELAESLARKVIDKMKAQAAAA